MDRRIIIIATFCTLLAVIFLSQLRAAPGCEEKLFIVNKSDDRINSAKICESAKNFIKKGYKVVIVWDDQLWSDQRTPLDPDILVFSASSDGEMDVSWGMNFSKNPYSYRYWYDADQNALFRHPFGSYFTNGDPTTGFSLWIANAHQIYAGSGQSMPE